MKRTIRNLWMILAVGLLLAAAGCAESDIDEDDGPQVYLEVAVTESPAITCQEQAGVQVIEVTEWTAEYTNVPKNSLATTSPFNDIEVISVTVSYDFPDVAVVVPPARVLPSPGTVPAAGAQSVKFEPILFQDLDATMLGTSAILNLDIAWTTPVDDEVFFKTIGEVMMIEACQASGS